MKLGRMMYNDNTSVPFKDEMNRSIRTEVTDNLLFQNRELPPFENFFLVISCLSDIYGPILGGDLEDQKNRPHTFILYSIGSLG